jgi:hypothetical protein
MALNLLDYRIRQRDYLLSITQAMISRLNVRAVLRLILQAAVDMCVLEQLWLAACTRRCLSTFG